MRELYPRSKMRILSQNQSLSPPFKSKSPRYTFENNQTHQPGPGTYTIPSLDQEKTSKYHIESKKESTIRQQFQWIFSTTRSKNLYSSNKNPNLGPGCYILKQPLASQPRSWSKGKRFDSFSTPNQSIVGPGSYDPEGTKISNHFKKGIQSMFKSKTPKISLFRETKNAQETTLNPIEIGTVQQQQEELQNLKKKDKLYSGVFASKVPRFRTESSEYKVGPGSYELDSKREEKEKVHRSMHIAHHAKSSVQDKPGLKRDFRIKSQVGPGSYNVKKFDMSYDLDYKGQPFTRETRFNFKNSKKQKLCTQFPGPGQYMQQKYIYSRDSQISNNSKLKKFFGAKFQPAQDAFTYEEEEKKMEGPGYYDVDKNNIENSLKRKIEHQKKLKVMEISLPGFSSKVPRFN